jgi:chromosome partitioning protein
VSLQDIENLTPEAEGPGPRVLAIANQKGGVGKTTTAINLATALAACGKRVLIVDLDPQGNASTGVGLDWRRRGPTIYEALLGATPLKDCVVESPVPNMSIVPSSVDLSGAEVELVAAERRDTRLREALRQERERWDYVLIDCPPALGLLTVNALVAADAVLVPLQAEFYALEGLSHLLRTIERVRRALNPDLALQGVVLTMYDRRNNLCDLVAQDVRAYLGDRVYRTVIPRNVRVSEAPSHGKPVLLYDLSCAGAQAYVHLAGEILRREEGAEATAALAS